MGVAELLQFCIDYVDELQAIVHKVTGCMDDHILYLISALPSVVPPPPHLFCKKLFTRAKARA